MEILNQFGINPILLAAQVVNFLILLFILKKFLYGPILKVLEARKKTIADSIKNAEEIEKRLAQTSEESEKTLARTLQEGEKILEETNKAAAQILADAQKTGVQIIEKASLDAKTILVSERGKLEEEVKDSLSAIVVLSLQKVLGKKITKEQRKIVDQTLKEN